MCAHLLVPLAFRVIPPSFVESQSRHSLCVIKRAFGVPCPGCGMTRAISCAFHGEFRRAWRHNKLVVVVLPLLGALWLRSLLAPLPQPLLPPRTGGRRWIAGGAGCFPSMW